MTAASKLDNDTQAIRDDIDALKRDMKDLLSHVKNAAQTGTADTMDTIAGQVSAAGDRTQAQAAAAMTAIQRELGEKPLLALGMAVFVGYLGGRLLTR
jgi:ElaB/YqjD/DUF883 family membrane-anchored ribosome-binding protein